MAFELLPSNFIAGLESDAAKVQGTLQFLASLPQPTTELVMRTAMQLGQPQNYSDAGWLDLMRQLGSVQLEESALNNQERSVYNTIRSAVNRPPSLACCGVVPVVSALTQLNVYPVPGSLTFQHQIEVILDPSTDCNIKSVDVILNDIGGAPVTIPLVLKCTFDKCTKFGRVFTYFYTTYLSDPSGGSYLINFNFKDANDISITAFVPSYSPKVFP